MDTALDIHARQPPGDILIFLTGAADVDKAVRSLNDGVASMPAGACGDLLVLPIYAALPPELQARVFAPAPPGVRRAVVATNIAETSITVDGVVYVIDPGLVKQRAYDPATGMDSLKVVPISRVQATQRAGRAGRTAPGKCYRLYTRRFYERDMPAAAVPEVQRTSLLGTVLFLKALPLSIDVLAFDYLDSPARPAMEDALRQLCVLDGIDGNGAITDVGRAMARLPLDPSLARVLLAASRLDCLEDALTVAAMLSADTIFVGGVGPEQLAEEDGRDGGGGGRDGGRDGPPDTGRRPHRALGPPARALLSHILSEGLGDHVLFLRLYQAWERAGFDGAWCASMGLDVRGMRFARDVRRQLEGVAGPGGSGLMGGKGWGGGGGGGGGGASPRWRRLQWRYAKYVPTAIPPTTMAPAPTTAAAPVAPR